MRVTSVTYIKINGSRQNVRSGGTFNPGGYERGSVAADNQAFVGYTQRPVASRVSVTAVHTSETDFAEMNEWANVTLEVYTDTGKQYVIAGAALTAPPELSGDEGEVALEFVGPPAQEF